MSTNILTYKYNKVPRPLKLLTIVTGIFFKILTKEIASIFVGNCMERLIFIPIASSIPRSIL
jgi:hypothetical protein